MAKKVTGKRHNITIEGARIIFRNFKGAQTEFNREGDRNFCVVLDPELADVLEQDGWNVKRKDPREEGDDPLLYLKVKVKFGDFPPVIKQVTSKGATQLDEDTVMVLDTAAIENVDLIITPYEYTVSGKSGVAAYLKKMYVTIQEDDLDKKYAHFGDVEEPPFD
jgi:hypothetical protein